MTDRPSSKVLSAGAAGAVLGALGGAAIAGALGDLPWIVGAATGALLLGVVTGWADATRVPGEPQPLFVRITAAAFIGAAVGGGLEWLLPDWSAAVPSALVGASTGLVGFRPVKIVLGLLIGLGVGVVFDVVWPDVGWAIPVALTVVSYRVVASIVWRGRNQLRVTGERVSPEVERFVVPFSEATGYVGVDYLERLADTVGAVFAHSPEDVGIVGDFDDLLGPSFDPGRVDPLVREFYEHTSRFTLTITPDWKWWMRIPYRVYRATVAEPIGQANAPFDQREVQEGVVSWIDTIDVTGDGTVDVRAWVRAYDSGEPLYVGIYTVQEIEGTAYVSVGFPVPAGNFTATLLPTNHRDTGLLLRSHTDAPYSGHYLSVVEEGGELTTIQLVSFGEEIDVFVDDDGELRTEHRFLLGGTVFLTLHYAIEKKVT